MTKDYYNKNANEFIKNTLDLDMSNLQKKFEKYLPKNAKILDLGFGSGRDSRYFHNKGFEVVSTDFSEEFVSIGKDLLDNKVILLDTLEMKFVNEFDGIWACASLLHFNDDDLRIAITNCHNALKKDGIMFTSFKKGTFVGERNGRIFHDFVEEDLEKLVISLGFDILEIYESKDIGPDRTEYWINLIIRR